MEGPSSHRNYCARRRERDLSFPEDPRASYGKVGHVTVTVPSQTNLHAELDVPVRYDFAYVSDFSGERGMDGSSGLDGRDSTSGTSGSMDPNNPSPAETVQTELTAIMERTATLEEARPRLTSALRLSQERIHFSK